MTTDVFLCYRHFGAQTAKLFKRYLENKGFLGQIWYSDLEMLGNYRNDIDNLVENAESIVIFVDDKFTDGFLDENSVVECITKYEIVSIAKKQLSSAPAQLFTVFLDRSGFSEEENVILKTMFSQFDIADAEKALNLIVQNNQICFSTRKDYEEVLFYNLEVLMLSNDFFKDKQVKGNFFFGTVSTSVDIVLWDIERGIDPEKVAFELIIKEIPFHKKIERTRSQIQFEGQNNEMISVLGFEVLLSDDIEEKMVYIKYKSIQYELFYKCLKLWDELGCGKIANTYDWRKDLYSIPNAMGLAFMVITADNKMMFTKRSNNRGIRPNEYDCSIVEGLKPRSLDILGNEYTLDDDGYIEKEIYRAFREEVCYVDSLNIKICGLVCDKEYGQWNLIGTIHTDYTSEEIKRLHATRADTYEDTYMEFVDFTSDGRISVEKLKPFAHKYITSGMWGMAFAAWYSALLDVGFTPEDVNDLTKEIESVKTIKV